MKITIVGTGYVDASSVILHAQYNETVVFETHPETVKMLNCKQLPIEDVESEYYTAYGSPNFCAKPGKHEAKSRAD